MFKAWVLAILILVTGALYAAPVQQQDENKPGASPQGQAPAQTPSPQANPQEAPAGGQDQSATPKDDSAKSKQPEPAKPKEDSDKAKDQSQPGQAGSQPNGQAQPAPQGSEAGTPDNPQQQPENKEQPQSNQPPTTNQAPQNSQQPSTTQPPQNNRQVPSSQQQQNQPSPCTAQDAAQGTCTQPPPVMQSHRKVIRRGSTGEPTAQLVPGMTPEQAAKHRQTTEGFLNSADDDLKRLAGRNLNQNQQDTVSQIHNYMQGSRSALDDGDLSRARILAFKAHLLADDLARH